MHEVSEAVPRPERALIEIYETQLSDVDFAGMSADTLNGHAREVVAAHGELESLQAQARAARERLEARRAELRNVAKQALAYARVFAADREDLVEALDDIELEPKKPRKKRARRKPKTTAPKAEAEVPQLQLSDEAPAPQFMAAE